MTYNEFAAECVKLNAKPLRMGTTRVHFVEVIVGSSRLMVGAEWTTDSRLDYDATLAAVRTVVAKKRSTTGE